MTAEEGKVAAAVDGRVSIAFCLRGRLDAILNPLAWADRIRRPMPDLATPEARTMTTVREFEALSPAASEACATGSRASAS